MSLLAGYDSDDDDEDAPSILAQAAAQATLGVDATGVAVGSLAASPSVASAPSASPPAAASPSSGVVARDRTASCGALGGGRSVGVPVASPLGAASSSPSSSRGGSPERGEDGIDLLPPSPLGEPDPELVDRVRTLHDLRRRGKSIRDHIQASRDWSNPYILERVIRVFELDEYSSNYPKESYDPSKIAEHPSDYYDAPECERPPLPKRQRRAARDCAGHLRRGVSGGIDAQE